MNNTEIIIITILTLVIGMILGTTIQILTGETTILTNEQQKQTQQTALKCYWATEYLTDPEGTTQFFDNQDYTEYYTQTCKQLAHENWKTITKDTN